MSVTVVVRVENGESPEVTFDGSRVVLGRSAGCDVRLPDASVSQRHATIHVDAGQHFLVDEGSTNGTFLGGARLEPNVRHLLRPSEMVRLGRVFLEIRIEAKPETRDLAVATRDLALGLVSQALRALGEDPRPRVLVVSGRESGRALLLEEEGRVYVVGRGESCDLPLSDPDASREHVRIVRRGNSVMVRDEDSKNGVFMGEEPIRQGRDVPWKGSAIVRAGGTHLALEEPAREVLAEIEKEDDERLSGDDVPPPPPLAVRESLGRKDLQAEAGPSESKEPVQLPLPLREKPKAAEASGLLGTERTIIAIAALVLLVSLFGLTWIFRTK